MDGDAVLREIRRIRPFVPVIMLTAYLDLTQEPVTLLNKSLTKGGGSIVLLTMIDRTTRQQFTTRSKPDSLRNDYQHLTVRNSIS
jgi:CheY-like chemotaxis protein